MKYTSEFIGELIGTFILVFFGCGAVAVTVIFSAHSGLFQVAAIWGIGVTLAIYATRHMSCAHLNPAVSIAMVVAKRMGGCKLLAYLAGQFTGALLAAAVLYLLFASAIGAYELGHGIMRGSPESIKTAMIFADFYPNPGLIPKIPVSMLNAFLAEFVGTFALVFLIFSLTEGCNVGRPNEQLAPLFIGMSITVIICIIAPLSQAGLNPARDLSPRIFAMLAGWRAAALPDENYGFLVVYVLGPIVGGAGAALFFTYIVEPLMAKKNDLNLRCKCG